MRCGLNSRDATITDYTWNPIAGARPAMALAIAAAARSFAWRYSYRARELQLSFSADDGVGGFCRANVDTVVDAEMRLLNVTASGVS